jgi:hypothetical protein
MVGMQSFSTGRCWEGVTGTNSMVEEKSGKERVHNQEHHAVSSLRTSSGDSGGP